MTQTALGKIGRGPLQVKSTDFRPIKGSKIAAFVF
jgi:hypothetical protein